MRNFDPLRLVRECVEVDIAIEGAEHGVACQLDVEPVGNRCDRDFDIADLRRGQRFVELQRRNRAVRPKIGVEFERAILGVAAAAGQRGIAIGKTPPRCGQRQLLRFHLEIVEQDRATTGEAHHPVYVEPRPGEVRDRAVGDVGDGGIEIGREAEPAAGPQPQIDPRAATGLADTVDRQPVGADRAGQAVIARADIAAQLQVCRKARRTQGEIVRQQPSAGIDDRPVGEDIVEPRIDLRHAGDDLLRPRVERENEARPVEGRGGGLRQPVDHVVAQRKAIDRQLMFDLEIAESAVERRLKPRAVERQPVGKQVRIGQHGIE